MDKVVGVIVSVVGGLAMLAVLAGLIAGWGALLEFTGLEDEFGGGEIYRALDSQCEQIQDARPGDVIGCQSPRDFVTDLRRACNGGGPLPAENFLFGEPGGTRIEPARCP